MSNLQLPPLPNISGLQAPILHPKRGCCLYRAVFKPKMIIPAWFKTAFPSWMMVTIIS